MMDSYNNNKRILNEARKKNKEKFSDDSKKRLITNIEKKFKTTMIGSLACFEDIFGELWGHNKEGELTSEEMYWQQKWEEVRTEVLNNGNNQLRAAVEEITGYTMSWDRYKTDFTFIKN